MKSKTIFVQSDIMPMPTLTPEQDKRHHEALMALSLCPYQPPDLDVFCPPIPSINWNWVMTGEGDAPITTITITPEDVGLGNFCDMKAKSSRRHFWSVFSKRGSPAS